MHIIEWIEIVVIEVKDKKKSKIEELSASLLSLYFTVINTRT